MNLIKKFFGNFVYGLGKAISFTFDIIISLIEFIVSLFVNVGKGILGLVSMGGCLFIIMLGPWGLALLLNPVTLTIIILFVLVPIIGIKSISYLKYLRYMVTEYLYDSAENLIKGKKREFGSFNEYGNKYRRMEEEKRRREQQRRQEEQQRMWEERFRQWYEYSQGQSYNYGGGQYQQQQTYVNPAIEFKRKYEESCDLLGVAYDADKYTIKLAYRKKAKEFHPDINKAPNATQMFQKINEAYEFLSDGNIERYKSMQ